MKNAETGFSLQKEVQLRLRPPVQMAGVIFDGRENNGIDKVLFKQFKAQNPSSIHLLVDFLRENQSQTVTFQDLRREYPIISDLFGNNKYWRDIGGVQYLSLRDAGTLFSSENNPEHDLEKNGKKSWNM